MEICAALVQCLIPKIASKLLKEKTGSKEHSTSHIHLDVRQACDIRIVMVRL